MTDDAILAYLGSVIERLRTPIDVGDMVLDPTWQARDVADDLALLHLAVSVRREQAV